MQCPGSCLDKKLAYHAPELSSASHTGHCYYFLEDVYPRQSGRRPLKTPQLIRMLFPNNEIRPMDTGAGEAAAAGNGPQAGPGQPGQPGVAQPGAR